MVPSSRREALGRRNITDQIHEDSKLDIWDSEAVVRPCHGTKVLSEGRFWALVSISGLGLVDRRLIFKPCRMALVLGNGTNIERAGY